MGSHGFLKDEFDSLESLLLILKFSAKDVIAKLPILASFVTEILKHAVGGYIVRVHFLDIQESLFDCQELALIEFNRVVEFSFFLRQLSILLLLFPELAGSLE